MTKFYHAMHTPIQRPSLDTPELSAWLTLAHTPGVPASAALALIATFGSPINALQAGPARLESAVGTVAARALLDARHDPDGRVAQATAWAAQPGHAIVPFGDPAYPPALLTIYDPPPLLYIKGHLAALHRPTIAIVGSRNPTPQGLDNARSFARTLASAGMCVVSGLALGIDGEAHRGALEVGGSTVGVVGTGVDVVYPSRHHALAHDIAAQCGALLSEWPLGAPPVRRHFPQRNRLIAGLARGVLVIEAATHSGSLITARLANEIGREIFAVPGSIHSPMSHGCHRLIRDGAKLVETAHDVLAELDLAEPGIEKPRRMAPADLELLIRQHRTRRSPCAPRDTRRPRSRAEGRQARQPVGRTRIPDRQAGGGALPGATGEERDTGHATLLAAIGHDPVTLETLSERTHLDSATLQAALLKLELAGAIVALPGGRVQRVAATDMQARPTTC
jgi:DNA processing protein